MTVVFLKLGMNFDTASLSPDLAFFDQHHGGNAGDGLRHRRNPEDGVLLHRGVGFNVALAISGQFGDLAVADDDGDEAGKALPVDVLLHHGVQPL